MFPHSPPLRFSNFVDSDISPDRRIADKGDQLAILDDRQVTNPFFLVISDQRSHDTLGCARPISHPPSSTSRQPPHGHRRHGPYFRSNEHGRRSENIPATPSPSSTGRAPMRFSAIFQLPVKPTLSELHAIIFRRWRPCQNSNFIGHHSSSLGPLILVIACLITYF